MTDREHDPDVPPKSLVGSTDMKGGKKEPEPPQGGAGEPDGVMGTAGVNQTQNNPTSIPKAG